ncbi:serine hydrolase domain-containing protein [Nitrospirillum sp. BR 11163]|uniref:serine hydrolase domain-containing protein n=1 Tax=Nitrospirillum sp. BR 11163 TaxID=3104323 RepID=UPI002B0017B8|nr:serine hydrolase domain-containing protein [Nitrospirillum sp. BR 11163]MEA1672727.1 serine hydrolase domain-containing protein [Nitrospirillum sp. BR 11163]
MISFFPTLARRLVMATCLLTAAAAAAEPLASEHPLTADDVHAFFDGLVPPALERGGIPGAVVIVVKDGDVLFTKGYGYADLATRRPVDPSRTLFRPGSISKTLLWTAVMQLVEAGRMDLDRDINAYLDFRIPDAWGKPITMRQLMTHAGGFEDRVKDIVFTEDQDPLNNEQFLKSWIPPRMFPPGTVTAYSNYGAALAGYIVARVSGQPFADYVEGHILAPLGMRHTTFRQPLPPALKEGMAAGYLTGVAAAQPFEVISPAPAGGLSTTAEDMARFMTAHLRLGRLGDARILTEETARLMHATALQASPVVNGLALGFRREDRNGQAIIGHAGGTILFHSDMHLFLDQDLGIFISMNSAGANDTASRLRQQVLAQFADRYFPQARADQAALPTALADGRQAAGIYEATQRSDSSFGAFFALLGQTHVSVEGGGILTVSTLMGPDGAPKRWREVAPHVWRDLAGADRLEVQLEGDRVARIVAPPLYVLQPVPAWRSAGWNLPLLLATLTVLLGTTVLWPLGALVRRLRRKAPPTCTAAELTRRRLARLAAVANLIFLGGALVFVIVVISPGRVPLNDRIDGWLRLFQIFGLIGALGSLAAVADAGAAWMRRRDWRARISSGAIALACAATVWFGIAFQMLGWSLDF